MQHFFNHWSGGDGKFIYDIYSGLIAAILGVAALGGLGIIYKRFLCHDSSCHKLAMHHVAGGQHSICGKHYREMLGLPKDHNFTIHHIRQAHQDHLDSQSS